MHRAASMGTLVALAVGLLSGAWAAVLGLRAEGAAGIGCVAVLGVGTLLAASTRSAPVRPGGRAWVPLGLAAALVGQTLAPTSGTREGVPPGVIRVEGRVAASGHGREPSAVVEVRSGRLLASGEALPWRARLAVRGLDAPTGTQVTLVARAHPQVTFHNPTPHPAWPGRGVDGRARLVGAARIDELAPLWQQAAHHVRTKLRAALGATLSDETSGLARALLLGEASALRAETREAVRGAGLSHVLAVSGLHVTLLAGMFVLLLQQALLRVTALAARLEVGRLARAAGVPFALSYALLVGEAPSAWRAALTASLAWGLAALGRRAHPAAVAAGAALLCALIRPDDLGRPGFVLSILATAALVSRTDPSGSWTATGLAVSGRTMIATAPFVLWTFGQVPVVGLLANLVMVPLAGAVLLPLAALHGLVALSMRPLAHASGPLVEAVAGAFIAGSSVFATVPLGHDLPPPDLAQGAVVGLAALGVLALRSWRARIAVVLVASLALAGAELWLRRRERPTEQLRVTFLDVGQGDGALVDLPDGRLMVVDAGGALHGGLDPGAHALAPLLRARRRSRIDVLVVSHPHPDHYGGMGALLDAFEIGEVWDTGQGEDENAEGAYAALLGRARAAGALVLGPDELCGSVRRFGAAEARVVWPCPAYDPGLGPNDNSLVVELRHAGRRVLFTGDVEVEAEAALLSVLQPVDVLKVAHHGSRTSSAEPLLHALTPHIAVASMGRHNQFGHPHAEVWERLLNAIACPYRTDQDGGVTVWIEPDGRISAESTLRDRPCPSP